MFTYAFYKALEHVLLPPSYRNLVDAAGQKVKSMVTLQNPQLDPVGDFDVNEAFLGARIHPVVYQVNFIDGHWYINAGLPQGININARLQINNGNNNIQVKVLEALHDKSRLQVDNMEKLDRQLTYSAQIIDPAIPKLPIAVEGDASLVQVLQQALNQTDDRYYLEESAVPEYLLNTTAHTITLARSNQSSLMVYAVDPQTGKKHSMPLPLLVEPIVNGTDTLTREQLSLKLATHMANWQRVMNIVYTIGAMPENLVEVVIEQYDPLTQQYKKLENIGDSFYLRYQQAPDGAMLKPHFKLSLELNAQVPWKEDVYVSLLYMDPLTGMIALMTPPKGERLRQEDKVILDGSSYVKLPKCVYYQYTKGNGSSEIEASIHDSLLAMSINQSTDYLKLFISNFELDVSNFQQPSLKEYLKGFFNGRRSMGFEDDEPVYNAITKTIALNTVYRA